MRDSDEASLVEFCSVVYEERDGEMERNRVMGGWRTHEEKCCTRTPSPSDVASLVEFRPMVLEEISEGTNGRTMDARTDAQKKIC